MSPSCAACGRKKRGPLCGDCGLLKRRPRHNRQPPHCPFCRTAAHPSPYLNQLCAEKFRKSHPGWFHTP